jgi:2-dehydro-3-deoxyphosphogluconate aldolase / (4S)-4-hydroxy-2-oxoglutarate aldolase
MFDKKSVLEALGEARVIGIFRVDDPSKCLDTMEALLKGGVSAFEITTTTPDAIDLIRRASDEFGERATIGIGTVLDAKTANQGMHAGAQFVVSPSLHKEVIDACKARGVVSCPGTFTATEVVQGWKWGADLIKIFPASQVGPEYIRALLGPLPWVKFVPTGGIDEKNAAGFLGAGAFCLGVGGSLIPKAAVAEGRFAEITERARALMSATSGAAKP